MENTERTFENRYFLIINYILFDEVKEIVCDYITDMNSWISALQKVQDCLPVYEPVDEMSFTMSLNRENINVYYGSRTDYESVKISNFVSHFSECGPKNFTTSYYTHPNNPRWDISCFIETPEVVEITKSYNIDDKVITEIFHSKDANYAINEIEFRSIGSVKVTTRYGEESLITRRTSLVDRFSFSSEDLPITASYDNCYGRATIAIIKKI